MTKIACSFIVVFAVSSAVSVAEENPWDNPFVADQSSFRYQQESLESECSDEAGYAKHLSAAMDTLIEIQGLNVSDIKSDENMISIDPNGGKAEVTIYDDSEYLNGSVSGRDIPDEVKAEFTNDVRRQTTLIALKYKADYEGKSFGDEFPGSVQREVWAFCMSRGEAVLSSYQN